LLALFSFGINNACMTLGFFSSSWCSLLGFTSLVASFLSPSLTSQAPTPATDTGKTEKHTLIIPHSFMVFDSMSNPAVGLKSSSWVIFLPLPSLPPSPAASSCAVRSTLLLPYRIQPSCVWSRVRSTQRAFLFFVYTYGIFFRYSSSSSSNSRHLWRGLPCRLASARWCARTAPRKSPWRPRAVGMG